MIVYAILLFAAAAALFVVGALVYRGRTGLIHAYHRNRVKDHAAYGRATGKALMGVGVPLLAAGVAALFTTSVWLTALLIIGLFLSFIPLFVVQKKYNGGMF